jgi:uncharacterized alpha-E superfamily protein
MLSRIAEELFWLGRYLSRAEHTARMLDGLFHVNIQARASNEPVQLSWAGLMSIMGGEMPEGEALTPEAVLARLTIDEDTPASVRSCVVGARERARSVRDVISREMWEAVNTFYLQILDPQLEAVARAGPYAVYQLTKDRCASFWGLTQQTMLRDEAHAFLAAGGRLESAQMVLRMLRVALRDLREHRADDWSASQLDGRARAVLHAVGGVQAYQRSTRLPAVAEPVARFVLFDRGYPEAVASSLVTLRALLANVDSDPREAPPLLRLERIGAELEFRRHTAAASELPPMFVAVQEELDHVDAEIERRYFAAAPIGSRTVFA